MIQANPCLNVSAVGTMMYHSLNYPTILTHVISTHVLRILHITILGQYVMMIIVHAHVEYLVLLLYLKVLVEIFQEHVYLRQMFAGRPEHGMQVNVNVRPVYPRIVRLITYLVAQAPSVQLQQILLERLVLIRVVHNLARIKERVLFLWGVYALADLWVVLALQMHAVCVLLTETINTMVIVVKTNVFVIK
jgi:hypothetical protein